MVNACSSIYEPSLFRKCIWLVNNGFHNYKGGRLCYLSSSWLVSWIHNFTYINYVRLLRNLSCISRHILNEIRDSGFHGFCFMLFRKWIFIRQFRNIYTLTMVTLFWLWSSWRMWGWICLYTSYTSIDRMVSRKKR